MTWGCFGIISESLKGIWNLRPHFLTRIPTSNTAKATRSSACGPWEAVNFSIETKNPRQNWMFACLPCGPGAKLQPHSNQNKSIAIAEGETWQRRAKRNLRNMIEYIYIYNSIICIYKKKHCDTQMFLHQDWTHEIFNPLQSWQSLLATFTPSAKETKPPAVQRCPQRFRRRFWQQSAGPALRRSASHVQCLGIFVTLRPGIVLFGCNDAAMFHEGFLYDKSDLQILTP